LWGEQVNAVKKHCGLCASDKHFTDQCPQIQEVPIGGIETAATFQH